MPPHEASPNRSIDRAAAIAAVDDWARQSFQDSVISRDTVIWNRVSEAVADLKQRLSNLPSPSRAHST